MNKEKNMLGNKKMREKKKHVLHFLMSQAMLSFMFHFMSYIIQRMEEKEQNRKYSENGNIKLITTAHFLWKLKQIESFLQGNFLRHWNNSL